MKNSKKGISLIVLVITIIVIIILAAAVILTLNKNNPIEEANDARYASDAANMQAILTNVAAKVMAEKQCVIDMKAGTVTNGAPGIEITFNNALDGTADGHIIFGVKGEDSDTTNWYTGKALPDYPGKTTSWAVDTEGNLTLTIGTGDNAKVYPKK